VRALNDRGLGKICDFKLMWLGKTGRALWRPLVSVNVISLLGSMSLDFVRTRLSNMHRCRAFPFALAGLFLYIFLFEHHSIKWLYQCANRKFDILLSL